MRKNSLNFIVDLLTLLAILLMTGTGLIMYFILPAGSGGRGLVLWGLGRHDWGDIHFWSAVALAVLLVLHLALHWAWVCGTIRRLVTSGRKGGQPRGKRDNAYGIAFLIVLIGGFTAFVLISRAGVTYSPAEAGRHDRAEGGGQGRGPAWASPDAGGGAQREDDSADPEEHSRFVAGVEIRGRTTLAEIEAAAGVSAESVISRLGLPQETPTDEALRVIADRHGLSMSAIRAAVAEAMEESRSEE
jgi:hypothetical protein